MIMAVGAKDKVVSAADFSSKIACSTCSLGQLCLPAGLDQDDVTQFEQIVHKSRPIQPGEHLFRTGDGFTAVNAVRSGCFKSYMINEDGTEQVLGFHLPGELIGLEAIYPEKHVANVVALSTSSVCSLQFAEVARLAGELPDLQSQLFRVMSQRISELNHIAADLTADERLAGFLLGLSQRFADRGYSPKEFNLAMSRADIANYLRLATETVSRVLARFQKKKLIEVNRKLVKLLDLDKLNELAGSAATFQP